MVNSPNAYHTIFLWETLKLLFIYPFLYLNLWYEFHKGYNKPLQLFVEKQ